SVLVRSEMASSSGFWLSAPFSGPSLTPLSPFCPHRTGDADDYHLAPLGGTAQLLCPLALWPVTVPTVVTWLRSPRPDGSQVVHVFRDGRDREEGVMPQYKGRTALLRDPREGSVSLEIRHVRLEDRGPYRCEVQIGNVTRQGTVTLQVAVLGSDPYIHVKGYDAGWIQLVCRSAGWFPQPLAEWRDPQGRVLRPLSDGHVLEAGLFRIAVSSRVRDSTLGNVSCTVRNLALGQEKTTAMLIAAPSPGRISSSAVALAVVLPVLGVVIIVGIFLIWKQRRSKENLLSDHAKEKGNYMYRIKSREQITKNIFFLLLHELAVTLDPDTAHPKLILSEDRRCVKLGDRRQPVPDGPQRFDFVVSVLGAEYFTAGCHYWEVDVGNKTKWALGVCSESVSRKGKVTATPANGHWLVRQSSEKEYEALTSPQTTLRLKEPPRCVGIFLDYEAGIISFYNVASRTHIFTFTHTFSGPLRPFFEPCLHDGGKNTAPLIICSELQKSEPSPGREPEEKGHANGDVAMNVDPSLFPPQASELFPPGDMILPWPSDLAPALQGLKVPSF
uniref:Erythroblast membrane associated protein (Scianna blood group) n=1 Tax=Ursus maritimus TaxID=29073 RepID=A0A452VJ97_URSMA